MEYNAKKVDEFIDLVEQACVPSEVVELVSLFAFDTQLDLSKTITNPAKLALLKVWDEMTLWERSAVLFDLSHVVKDRVLKAARELSEEARRRDEVEETK